MFLDEMMERLAKITDTSQMKDEWPPAEHGETFVADLSASAKRVKLLAWQYRDERRQLKSMALRMEAQILNEERDEAKSKKRIEEELFQINLQLLLLKDKSDVLKDIFWIIIHEETDHLRSASSKGIGVRKGHKVYDYYKEKPPKITSEFLGSFILPLPPEE